MRYALKISYDGTRFAGWQRQKNGLSVQEELEKAIFIALGAEKRITASGRTDAGVHAAGQVCHFDLESSVPPEKMPDCLNRFLPSDIRVLEGWEASPDFDSNRSAKKKTYCYSLYQAARDMPLKDRYAVRVENLPSAKLLQGYARLMEGEHDFKGFCASGSSVKTTVRTVYEIRVEEGESFDSRDVKLYVTGNGFLCTMVRIMVGELLDLALQRRSEESLQRAFQTGDRSLLGKTMPAKGLTLLSVVYGEN